MAYPVESISTICMPNSSSIQKPSYQASSTTSGEDGVNASAAAALARVNKTAKTKGSGTQRREKATRKSPAD